MTLIGSVRRVQENFAEAYWMPLIWTIWLPALAYPIGALLGAHPSVGRQVAVLAACALFVVLYVWIAWHSRVLEAIGRGAATAQWLPSWLAVTVIVALAVALTLGDRNAWLEIFIYASAGVAGVLRTKRALAAVGALLVLTTVVGWLAHASASQVIGTLFSVITAGVATIVFTSVIVVHRELRLAREEIARLAVSEERLRFARDLHDLLGHSLSMIALKSELARRLMAVDADRAASEMQDVEEAARTALQEVRDAVAGYRQPTLESELAGARQMLEAAGIVCDRDGTAGTLPSSVEAALSWAVREGVTNVIRHSGARRCTIHLSRDTSCVCLDITDDGRGDAASPALEGSGLAGLSERVEKLGGQVGAGPLPRGGFHLAVTLPLGVSGPPSAASVTAGAIAVAPLQ